MKEQLLYLDQLTINLGATETTLVNIILAFVMFGVALGIKLETFKDVFGEYGLKAGTCMSEYMSYDARSQEFIKKNFNSITFENELKQGFITIEGGHRVGISGQVYVENGEVKNFKNIS